MRIIRADNLMRIRKFGVCEFNQYNHYISVTNCWSAVLNVIPP